MRSSRYCIGDGSPGAAARFRASSLVMASLSKKSLRAAERKRADVARARRHWIREQGWLDTTRLVFIDETAVTTNMALDDLRLVEGILCLIENGKPRLGFFRELGPHLSEGGVLGVTVGV